MRRHHPAWGILLALAALTLALPASALERVRLQLKWQHQFQFAGYYAAQQQGYYHDAGLEVEILPASPGVDAVDEVLQGRAEYGVGSSGLLLRRGAGDPVVVLAVIMQHSPFVLITRQESTVEGIRGLAGKRLMIEPLADEIVALLNHHDLPLDSFAQVLDNPHNLDAFIAGEVDATDAYSTDEPYELMRRGIPFHLFTPRSAGIDFYGDNLFTTEAEIANHPERTRRFREASLRGWDYAMAHPEEIIELILNGYPGDKDRDFLVFEARQMEQLMLPELIDIGYMLEERWRHIADTYTSLGMLAETPPLAAFIYDATEEPNLFWFYMVSLSTLTILSIVTLVAVRFVRLNHQLTRLLHVKNQFANVGESVNNIAHQWKQPLNELAIQLMRIRLLTSKQQPDTSDLSSEIRTITDKGHTVLEFMAQTIDAFGHTLNTRDHEQAFLPQGVIDDVLFIIRDTFATQQITIHTTLTEDDESTVYGNPTEFAHVILSILNNARDIFIERHTVSPTITIGSHTENGRFVLEITDNGGGIKATPADAIFALGFSDKDSPDTGIGLYIARRIIERGFAGTITARNTGIGAAFVITLPISSKP